MTWLSEITYIKDDLSIDPDRAFQTLCDIDWVQRESAPRKEYWDTTKGLPYTYGRGVGMRTYEPNEPVAIIDEVRDELLSKTGIYYHGCFLNRYDSGRHGIGWHTDDDPAINHEYPIIVVSYGQERDIQVKEIGTKGMDAISTYRLEHGSIFIMPAGFQQTHLHRIPKFSKDGTRISLTFRALL